MEDAKNLPPTKTRRAAERLLREIHLKNESLTVTVTYQEPNQTEKTGDLLKRYAERVGGKKGWETSEQMEHESGHGAKNAGSPWPGNAGPKTVTAAAGTQR